MLRTPIKARRGENANAGRIGTCSNCRTPRALLWPNGLCIACQQAADIDPNGNAYRARRAPRTSQKAKPPRERSLFE